MLNLCTSLCRLTRASIVCYSIFCSTSILRFYVASSRSLLSSPASRTSANKAIVVENSRAYACLDITLLDILNQRIETKILAIGRETS